MIKIIKIENSINDRHDVIDYAEDGDAVMLGAIWQSKVYEDGPIYMFACASVISESSYLRLIADKIDELNVWRSK